jgi:hypothetical protein
VIRFTAGKAPVTAADFRARRQRLLLLFAVYLLLGSAVMFLSLRNGEWPPWLILVGLLLVIMRPVANYFQLTQREKVVRLREQQKGRDFIPILGLEDEGKRER